MSRSLKSSANRHVITSSSVITRLEACATVFGVYRDFAGLRSSKPSSIANSQIALRSHRR